MSKVLEIHLDLSVNSFLVTPIPALPQNLELEKSPLHWALMKYENQFLQQLNVVEVKNSLFSVVGISGVPNNFFIKGI